MHFKNILLIVSEALSNPTVRIALYNSICTAGDFVSHFIHLRHNDHYMELRFSLTLI